MFLQLIRISNPVCVFWNEVSSEWDTAGVATAAIIKGEIGESKTFDVECESVHLTVFGVIVDQETEVCTSFCMVKGREEMGEEL